MSSSVSSVQEESQSPTPSAAPSETEMSARDLKVEFPLIDPSLYIPNPHLIGGLECQEFLKSPVEEKMGVLLIDLIQQYQIISNISYQMSLNIVKAKLQTNDLCYSDCFTLVEKSFQQMAQPSLNLPGQFISFGNNLALVGDKYESHKLALEHLKQWQSFVQKTLKDIKCQVHANEMKQAHALKKAINAETQIDMGDADNWMNEDQYQYQSHSADADADADADDVDMDLVHGINLDDDDPDKYPSGDQEDDVDVDVDEDEDADADDGDDDDDDDDDDEDDMGQIDAVEDEEYTAIESKYKALQRNPYVNHMKTSQRAGKKPLVPSHYTPPASKLSSAHHTLSTRVASTTNKSSTLEPPLVSSNSLQPSTTTPQIPPTTTTSSQPQPQPPLPSTPPTATATATTTVTVTPPTLAKNTTQIEKSESVVSTDKDATTSNTLTNPSPPKPNVRRGAGVRNKKLKR
jgi:hypothetical protein